MSIYQCEECGCAENTACGWYHYTIHDDERYNKRNLCSACGPKLLNNGSETGLGRWHGRFERRFYPLGVMKTSDVGNLEIDSKKALGRIASLETSYVVLEQNNIVLMKQLAQLEVQLAQRIAKLEAALKDAREALGFYADKLSWNAPDDSNFMGSIADIDLQEFRPNRKALLVGGKRAREALDKLDEALKR